MSGYVAYAVCTLHPDEHRVAIVVAHREGQEVVLDAKERDLTGEQAAQLAQRFGIGSFMAELATGGDPLAEAERAARWLAGRM